VHLGCNHTSGRQVDLVAVIGPALLPDTTPPAGTSAAVQCGRGEGQSISTREYQLVEIDAGATSAPGPPQRHAMLRQYRPPPSPTRLRRPQRPLSRLLFVPHSILLSSRSILLPPALHPPTPPALHPAPAPLPSSTLLALGVCIALSSVEPGQST
jgi:hypothetical protein